MKRSDLKIGKCTMCATQYSGTYEKLMEWIGFHNFSVHLQVKTYIVRHLTKYIFMAVAKHTCEKKKTGKTEVRHTPSGQNLKLH